MSRVTSLSSRVDRGSHLPWTVNSQVVLIFLVYQSDVRGSRVVSTCPLFKVGGQGGTFSKLTCVKVNDKFLTWKFIERKPSATSSLNHSLGSRTCPQTHKGHRGWGTERGYYFHSNWRSVQNLSNRCVVCEVENIECMFSDREFSESSIVPSRKHSEVLVFLVFTKIYPCPCDSHR